jgi:hypothetical protein
VEGVTRPLNTDISVLCCLVSHSVEENINIVTHLNILNDKHRATYISHLLAHPHLSTDISSQWVVMPTAFLTFPSELRQTIIIQSYDAKPSDPTSRLVNNIFDWLGYHQNELKD